MLHNEEKETIVVMVDYKGTERQLRPFYCIRCGKCVCEITGQGKVLIPGDPDPNEIKELDFRYAVKCKGAIYNGKVDPRIQCNAKYIFN
jgi:hypothetical protein